MLAAMSSMFTWTIHTNRSDPTFSIQTFNVNEVFEDSGKKTDGYICDWTSADTWEEQTE